MSISAGVSSASGVLCKADFCIGGIISLGKYLMNELGFLFGDIYFVTLAVRLHIHIGDELMGHLYASLVIKTYKIHSLVNKC